MKQKKLTARQLKFIREYPKDFNGAAAAIRAGYSKKTARTIASELLTKPDMRQFVNKHLSEIELSAEETTKLLGDMAKSNLNDYFVIKKVEHTPRITVSLNKIIYDLVQQIEFEDEFAYRAKFSKDELKVHQQQQASRKREVIRLELELEKNPKATRIIYGPTEWIDVAELDMVKLAADKERGKIKSVAHTQHGIKVELCAADTALANIAKMHGLFAKDNEQSKPVINAPMTDEQVAQYIAALREPKPVGK